MTLITKHKSINKPMIIKILIILSMILVPPTIVGTPTPKRLASVAVIEAYYCDSDNDGLEDDVETILHINFVGAVNHKYEFYPVLTLPSGRNFAYKFTVKAFRQDTLDIQIIFLNHAIEPGDYLIEVHLFWPAGGNLYTYTGLIFDPPGIGNSDGQLLLWNLL